MTHTPVTLATLVTAGLQAAGIPTDHLYVTLSLHGERATVGIQPRGVSPQQAEALAVALGLSDLHWSTVESDGRPVDYWVAGRAGDLNVQILHAGPNPEVAAA